MTSESFESVRAPARRSVMAAAGAAGLAVALTACSSSDDSASSGSPDTRAGADAGGGDPADTSSAAAGGGTALAKTADIPEGGGKIFKDQGVVVTQPTAGTYKAFSAKCTHRGCAVSRIADGVIVCPCHNSRFSVSDGSVKKGPATQGLPEEKITVSGDSITLV